MPFESRKSNGKLHRRLEPKIFFIAKNTLIRRLEDRFDGPKSVERISHDYFSKSNLIG